jgi:hypothetical protein
MRHLAPALSATADLEIMKMDRSEEWMTISEAAAILLVPVSQIESMIDGGRLKTALRDNAVYLRSNDLERIARDSVESRSHSPHKALRWAVVAAAGATIVASVIPNLSIGEYHKEAHWVAYLVLTTLVTVSLVGLRTTLMSISLVLAMGAFLEYLQNFIPGRDAQFDDWTANYLGVISGFILGFWLKQHWRRQGRSQEN